MNKAFLIPLLASTMMVGVCGAQELVTVDRIGSADAPKTMTFRVNTDQSNASSHASQAEGFTKLYQTFAEKHPDWQINIEHYTPDIGSEHAKHAGTGAGRTCAGLRDRRFLPARAFHQAGRARPDRRVFQQGGNRRPLPLHQGRHYRTRRQDLRLVVEHRPARALPQQGPRAECTADLG